MEDWKNLARLLNLLLSLSCKEYFWAKLLCFHYLAYRVFCAAYTLFWRAYTISWNALTLIGVILIMNILLSYFLFCTVIVQSKFNSIKDLFKGTWTFIDTQSCKQGYKRPISTSVTWRTKGAKVCNFLTGVVTDNKIDNNPTSF